MPENRWSPLSSCLHAEQYPSKRNSLMIRKNTYGYHHIIPRHCNWKEIRSGCDFEYQNNYPRQSKPWTIHTSSLCFRTHCREHVRFLQPGQVYFAGCWWHTSHKGADSVCRSSDSMIYWKTTESLRRQRRIWVIKDNLGNRIIRWAIGV